MAKKVKKKVQKAAKFLKKEKQKKVTPKKTVRVGKTFEVKETFLLSIKRKGKLILSNKKLLRVIMIVFFICTGLIAAVMLIMPYIPGLIYQLNPPKVEDSKYSVIFTSGIPEPDQLKALIPAENRLIVPKIGVDAEILDGRDITVLDRKDGVWRDPVTKNPEVGGNMVIAGHRYQYLPPNSTTFYLLDKVAVGDKILVFWNKKAYMYKVFNIKDVYPYQTEIRKNDPNVPNKVTLYTCTPLGGNSKRLVIEAALEPL